MSMYSGNFNIESIFFGDIELGSCYLGDTLVWEKNVSEVNYIFRNIDANGNLTLATGTLPNADEIIKVGNYGLAYAFYNCTGLTGTLNLSNLTTVGEQGLNGAFESCSNLTDIYFNSLTTIGKLGMWTAFWHCTNITDIYFNSLTTTSFGSYRDQFTSMLSFTNKTTTHTLHFPSNLVGTIGKLNDYPTFGGVSGYVILAFDLPATS